MLSGSWFKAASPEDAICGVVPRRVAEPASAQELAAMLAQASHEGWLAVIRGGGSKIGWGRVPPRVDLVVSTKRLDRLSAHRYGDLTATVQAGMRLSDLNRALARHGQRLPLESAFEDATVGGVVSTNDAGPSRHRHGTPRDLLIGATLALTDGRVVKSGGTVVKNVAGYDLGRMVSGSFGAYAAIVEATFKLVPLPQASATLVAASRDAEAVAESVAAVAASQLEPEAIDLRAALGGSRTHGDASYQLLMRFASSPQATEAQMAAARGLVRGDLREVRGEAETALWSEQVRAQWGWEPPVGAAGGADDRTVVVRFSWLPAKLRAVLGIVQDVQQQTQAPALFIARAGVGSGFLTLGGSVDAQASAVEALRGRAEVGHVVIVRASPELKTKVDVWGPEASSVRMARALKQMFDPAGVLNAGRGVV